MSVAFAGFALVLATSISNLIWGEPKSPAEHKPYQIHGLASQVRELQRATDAVVAGEPDAYERRMRMSMKLAEDLAKVDLAQWSDPGNGLALVRYVLIGGDPSVLRTILRRGGVEEAQRNMALGVLAFAEKRGEQARQYLAKVDVSTLPADMALGLQLALASSLAETEPDKAADLLDAVRIGAPGTQIEASAMRQLVAIHLAEKRSAQALAAMQQYFRRFSSSRFNEQFIIQFAAELAQNEDPTLVSLIASFAAELHQRHPEVAVMLLVDLARQSVFRGRLELAVAAGSAVQAMTDVPDDYRLRARLYSLAAAAATDTAPAVLIELRSFKRAGLLPAEIELLDAALAIAAQIPGSRKSGQAEAAAAKAAAAVKPASGGPAIAKVPDYVARAQDVLKSAEQSLVKGKKP